MSIHLALFLAWSRNLLAGAPPDISGFDDLSWILNALYSYSIMIGLGIFMLIVILAMMKLDVLGIMKSKIGKGAA